MPFTVHPSYIRCLHDNVLDFGDVTCQALLALLRTNYGTICQADLKENQERMQAPWAPPIPIKYLFTHFEVGQRFAVDGLDPLTDNNIIRTGYNIIKNTDLFIVACCEWRQHPILERKMDNFQTHFRLADVYQHEDKTS
jgi:hypothetical protein